MEVFLLIISIVVGLLSGGVFLGTTWVKNSDQKYWDETYKQCTKNQPVEVPEEVVYNIIMKCRIVSGIIICACLIISIICVYSLIIK
jgi:hypothetical protein